MQDKKEKPITHIMKDGRIVDSIDGIEVPYNEHTVGVYEMLARYAIAGAREKQEGKGGTE